MLVYLAQIDGSNEPGFYSWENTTASCKKINSEGINNWTRQGNIGTDSSIDFLGTTDNTDLVIKTNNIPFWRVSASDQLESLQNRGAIYIGENAGEKDESDTFSFDNFANIFIGKNAGELNTTGEANVALGPLTLKQNIVGIGNTAIGSNVLANSISDFNTGIGVDALKDITTGNRNTAIGASAFGNTTTGEYNVALDYSSGISNTSG